jgi:hypothetical protein
MTKTDLACEPSPQIPRPPPSIGTNDRPLREYLTRRQAAQYINDELGRPMSFSTASKLAALGEFALPALWWGRRPLYTRTDLRAWAQIRSLLTKAHAPSDVGDRGMAEDQVDEAAQRGTMSESTARPMPAARRIEHEEGPT